VTNRKISSGPLGANQHTIGESVTESETEECFLRETGGVGRQLSENQRKFVLKKENE